MARPGRVEVKVNTRGFRRHLEQIHRAAIAGVEDATDELAEEIRAAAPVGESRRLVESITPLETEVNPRGVFRKVVVGIWYGGIVERGRKGGKTGRTRGRRYMRNPFYRLRGDRVAAAIARRL